jgi:hypothetical protein
MVIISKGVDDKTCSCAHFICHTAPYFDRAKNVSATHCWGHRISKASSDPGDPIFKTTPIVNLMGDFQTGIRCRIARRDPINALGRITIKPRLKLERIGEPRLGANQRRTIVTSLEVWPFAAFNSGAILPIVRERD